MLIQNLPPESATWTALRNELSDEDLAEQAEKGDPEKGRWSQLEHLVATVADRVARVEHVLVCAHTDSKRKRPEPPQPIPRPGTRTPRPKTQMNETGAEFLFTLINGAA